MKINPLRWEQRLDNLLKAHKRLISACSLGQYNELELAGLIQTFEFTFELTWKTLKDLLEFEGYTNVASPRSTIRTSLTAEYLSVNACENLLDMLNKRNLFTHTYDDATAQEAKRLIIKEYQPTITQVVNNLNAKVG